MVELESEAQTLSMVSKNALAARQRWVCPNRSKEMTTRMAPNFRVMELLGSLRRANNQMPTNRLMLYTPFCKTLIIAAGSLPGFEFLLYSTV